MADERAAAVLESADLLERLAAVEHERWAHWQSYVHQQCHKGADGSLTIPADLVEQWQRQIHTPYADLTDEERASDREQVLRYLPVLRQAISGETGDSEEP